MIYSVEFTMDTHDTLYISQATSPHKSLGTSPPPPLPRPPSDLSSVHHREILASSHRHFPTLQEGEGKDQTRPRPWRSNQHQSSSLVLHLAPLFGPSLIDSPDPLSLFQSLLHVQLGYLGMLQSGYIHRDLHIGNMRVLLTGVPMRQFQLDTTLVISAEDEFVLQSLRDTEEEAQFDFEMQGDRLKNILGMLQRDRGFGSDTRGFVIDGDMAAWADFAEARTSPRSGTREFMSLALQLSVDDPNGYFHSPVDDLNSVFYGGQWAAVYNPANNGSQVPWLRRQLAMSMRELATNTIAMMSPCEELEYGRFMVTSAELLQDWKGKLQALGRKFKDLKSLAASKDGPERISYLRLAFLTAAYGGVADYAETFYHFYDRFSQY
ncbi:Pkinase-fungal domain-containing protein [Mycena kentingensis (nom. inval.)]|nr:Pkinase-fungal domain-containing protein [Mycena kentingensis (nom. inval.)]